jgi:hypothetical protein
MDDNIKELGNFRLNACFSMVLIPSASFEQTQILSRTHFA